MCSIYRRHGCAYASPEWRQISSEAAPIATGIPCQRCHRHQGRTSAPSEDLHRRAISYHILELALADDPDRYPKVLTPEEQQEQLGMIRHCDGVMRMLREELPGRNGLSLFEALAVLEREFGK